MEFYREEYLPPVQIGFHHCLDAIDIPLHLGIDFSAPARDTRFDHLPTSIAVFEELSDRVKSLLCGQPVELTDDDHVMWNAFRLLGVG